MEKEEGKIFVVTRGEYSDYHIDRVFSSRRLANEYLDTKDDSYSLEVYNIDEPIVRKTEVYRVIFYLDRKKVFCTSIVWRKVKNEYKDLIRVYNQRLEIYVESDSRKRALKVASERYGAILANEQTMYPYLRVPVLADFMKLHPGHYDFNTGELVLVDGDTLGVILPPFIKVRDNTKK